MKKKYLHTTWILLLMLLVSMGTFAQRDNDFWFALPTISQQVDGSPPALNQPDSLRITAYGQTAHVILSIPANAGSSFNTTYGTGNPLTIPPNTTVSVGLTTYLSDLESRPPDVVTSTGLHITSDQAVSVYYELANYENGNFWLMKGRNAIGNSFYIPGQTFLPNAYSGNYNTMNIVASTDGNPVTHLTTVTITPSTDIVMTSGTHPAGTPYTVTLGKGQAYTAQDVSTAANSKLAGSTVTSDYPIAITESDDYMATEACNICSGGYWDNGIAGHDAGGDQIVPLSKIGTEYIAVRGGMTVNPEKLFVLTTVPNTNVYQDGVLVTSTSMPVPNAGTTVPLDLSQSSVSSYISADHPVYVSQISGMISEPGWNILPPITSCNGSTSVAYYRTFANSDNGVLFLLATNGGQNGFQYYINGVLQSGHLPVTPVWTAVPGAPAGWVATQINVSSAINDGDAILVTNPTPFTMGVVTGAYDVGSTSNATGLFGYFSNFGGIDIPPIANIPCAGDTLYLTADSLIGGVYSWTGPGGFISHSQDTFIYPFDIADTGKYYLTVSSSSISCTSYDSVDVSISISCCPKPHIVLAQPDSACIGATITLTDTSSGATRLWSTGATTTSITVGTSGTYWLRVTQGSCTASDTAHLFFIGPPSPFSLGNDTIYCGPFSRTLSSGQLNTLWSTGAIDSTITVNTAGIYWAQNSNLCGHTRDSITISEKPLPGVNIGNDTTICSGSTLVLNAATDSATYLWQNGTTDSTLSVSTTGIYRVIITVNGCSQTDSIVVSNAYPPVINLAADTTICTDSVLILNVYLPSAHYNWNTGDSTSSITASQSGTYSVTVTDACGSATASENVTTKPCVCKVAIPTAFSPNDDSKNDYFYVLTQCPLQNFQFDIYNRWGQKVFNTNNVTDKWNGAYRGAQQPLGVYVYFLKYTDPYTGKETSQTGNVTLLR